MQKEKISHLNYLLFNSVLYDNYDNFVKKLFEYSSLINYQNKDGENILHKICLYGIIDKYYASINMGAIPTNTNNGNSILHYASLSGKDNFLIVEIVKSGIMPNQKNNIGETSLHVAKNEQIAHYLHLWCNRNDISILDLKDNEGNYVIDTARKLKNMSVVKYWKQHYKEFN